MEHFGQIVDKQATLTQQQIKERLAISLRRFVKGEKSVLYSFTNEILRYVGLSPTDFREYIESQFMTGMHWRNYCQEWLIDHIVPVSLFDMHEADEKALCWHFLNLMPLWGAYNKRKADSLEFSSVELKRRLDVLPTNRVLKTLYGGVEAIRRQDAVYDYDVSVIRHYVKINYLL